MPRLLRFTAPVVALAAAVAVALTAAPASAQTTEQKLGYPVAGTKDPDTGSTTIGTKFTVAKAGKVLGVEFFRVDAQNQASTVQLWGPGATALATASGVPSSNGWVRANFATPVTVSPGTTYIASYFAPTGHYTHRLQGFAQARTSGDLTAPIGAGLYRYGATATKPNSRYQNEDYYVTPVFTADVVAPPSSTTSTTTTTTTTTPPPVAACGDGQDNDGDGKVDFPDDPGCSSADDTDETDAPPQTGWPDDTNTGVPAGTALTDYTGPCTITTADTVIDSKRVNCDLDIRAAGVQITKSQVTGSVFTPDDKASTAGFTLTDSSVAYPTVTDTGRTMVGAVNFTVLRSNIKGGNRGIYCRYRCTVQDSYITGTLTTGITHASAVRMSQYSTIVHNTLWCSAQDVAPDGGCSADLTGYGDFEPVHDNLIKNNLFHATPGGACAYGGSSGDNGAKPYGNQASNIVFQDNVFQRGAGGKCGFYFPITDFDSTRPGNQWINNTWEDGAQLPPAN